MLFRTRFTEISPTSDNVTAVGGRALATHSLGYQPSGFPKTGTSSQGPAHQTQFTTPTFLTSRLHPRSLLGLLQAIINGYPTAYL